MPLLHWNPYIGPNPLLFDFKDQLSSNLAIIAFLGSYNQIGYTAEPLLDVDVGFLHNS